MTSDQPRRPGGSAPVGPEQPQPGPLGWLEMTVEVMRDRSHAGWMLLGDAELLGTLRDRGVVAAYLPGAEVATPDVVVLRVAVSPEGRVAVAPPGGPPVAGEPVEEWLPGLLDELRTVAGVGPGEQVGPPWLPVEEIVEAAHAPTQDVRSVYCYRGTETLAAGAFARELGMPLSVRVEDGWVVAATPRAPEKVLTGPPGRLSGAFPFVALDRRGRRRVFTYVESARAGALAVRAEWRPPLRPLTPDGAHPGTEDLARWLADPAVWEQHAAGPGGLPASPERRLPAGMTAEQDAVLARWTTERDDAEGFLAEACAAFGVPVVAARLAETAPGEPDPGGGRTLEPQKAVAFVAGAIAEADAEPEGRMPWTVVSRMVWRQPLLGLALGAGELLVAAVLLTLVVVGDRAWWWWAVVVVFALVGLAHVGEAVLRLRWRPSRRPGPAADG